MIIFKIIAYKHLPINMIILGIHINFNIIIQIGNYIKNGLNLVKQCIAQILDA